MDYPEENYNDGVNNINNDLYTENIKLKEIISSKNKLIKEFQEVIQLSTIKIKQMQKINEMLTNKQSNKLDENELLESLNEIKQEVEEIENNYENKLKDTNIIIDQLQKDVEQLRKDKNDLMNMFNDYNDKNEKEKQALYNTIKSLRKQIFFLTNSHNENNIQYFEGENTYI